MKRSPFVANVKKLTLESMEELVTAIGVQGAKVKEVKTSGTKDEIATEVAKLVELKQQLTAVAPEHELALKDKKKKKDAADKKPEKNAKKEARKLEREKRATTDDCEVPVIMSQEMTDRQWTAVKDLRKDTEVWVRARVHLTRAKGSLAFTVLRQSCFTVQCVGSGSLAKPMGRVPSESIVDVFGKVTEAVTTCTQPVEIQVAKFLIVSKALPDLPFQVVDASKSEDSEGVTVGLDTRLNYRIIDLRTPAMQAIMRVKSAVPLIFASYLDSKGFVGVQSPKLLAGASEGGSSVFSLEYFGRPACLAQSPQLYKQMLAACSDFEKVYEIGPVFRAEDSNTRRHLCEFTGLDLEMAIFEHYYEVLDVFADLFAHIFSTLQAKFARELEIISQVYPFKPFRFLKKALRITFAEGIAMLHAAGVEAGDYDDLSTENEKKLGDLVAEKYQTDYFIMDKYPLSIRPFYTMPDPETYPSKPPEEQLSNSFDMFMRGQEIVSGAQRIHDHTLLMERVNFCHSSAGHGGPPPDSIKSYTDAFKYGAFPHGGGGVGLERVVMLYLGLTNIRKASLFPRDPSRLTP